MTPERLDEIEARAKAAQSGPWTAKLITLEADEDGPETPLEWRIEWPTGEGCWLATVHIGACADAAELAETEATARLIAATPSDVPDLIAEVRSLREQLIFAEGINDLYEQKLTAARSETHELLADCYKALHEQYREAQPSYDMPPEPADEWSYKIVPLFVAIQRATGKNHDELIRALPLDPDERKSNG